MFEGFDFSGFWKESEDAQKWNCGPLTPEMVANAEKVLGRKLPASYVWLMERHNGGIPVKRHFPTIEPNEWAEDHVEIEAIYGINRKAIYIISREEAISGIHRDVEKGIVWGSRSMLLQWEYPSVGIVIGHCPGAYDLQIFLDYRMTGPDEEPPVSMIDWNTYAVYHVADTFEEFIRGLTAE